MVLHQSVTTFAAEDIPLHQAERYYSLLLADPVVINSPRSLINAHFQLGKTQGYLCKYFEASENLATAKTLEDKLSGNSSMQSLEKILELARLHYDFSNYREAVYSYLRAAYIINQEGYLDDDPLQYADLLNELAQSAKIAHKHQLKELGYDPNAFDKQADEAEKKAIELYATQIKSTVTRTIRRYNLNCSVEEQASQFSP